MLYKSLVVVYKSARFALWVGYIALRISVSAMAWVFSTMLRYLLPGSSTAVNSNGTGEKNSCYWDKVNAWTNGIPNRSMSFQTVSAGLREYCYLDPFFLGQKNIMWVSLSPLIAICLVLLQIIIVVHIRQFKSVLEYRWIRRDWSNTWKRYYRQNFSLKQRKLAEKMLMTALLSLLVIT